MASKAQINYIRQRAASYGLDPEAVLAIAHHEGLGGGIGDNGTSFGPWQLHFHGAYPSSAPQGTQAANAWAWSPAGIDYALGRMATVAKGLTGQSAVAAISRRFERPANPAAEISDAMSVYGGNPGTGAPAGGGPSSNAPSGLAGMFAQQPNQGQHLVTSRVSTLGTALSARLFQNAQELAAGQQPTGLKDLFTLAKGFQQARRQAPLGGTVLAQQTGMAAAPARPFPTPAYTAGQSLGGGG